MEELLELAQQLGQVGAQAVAPGADAGILRGPEGHDDSPGAGARRWPD